MAILLLADHDNAHLSDQTAKALTAALQIGADVHVLVAGSNARAAAEQAAKLSGVTKIYGSNTALDGINLAVPGGCYVSLLGPSGSGKTTLLRVIAGFEEPDRGEVAFDGRRIDGTPAHLRGIGFVFQNFALFPHLSVWKNVAFGLENAEASRLSPKEIETRVRDMIALVGLTGAESERRVRNYSLGMRQRLGIANALIGDPSVLILDEPANGLDPAGIHWMRSLLRGYAERGGTVLLSSHLLHEVEMIADDMVLIGRGRIVAQGTKAELLQTAGTFVKGESHHSASRTRSDGLKLRGGRKIGFTTGRS